MSTQNFVVNIQNYIENTIHFIKNKQDLVVNITKLLKNSCMTIEEQEKHIYSRLRQERENLNWSQLELSLESGVSQNMITYIETGKRTPSLSTVLKLCNAMKIDPSILFLKHDMEKERAKQTVIEIIQKYM